MNLSLLEELELRGNKLSIIFEGIPPEKGSQIFPRLKSVDLTQNRFEKVPELLVNLPNLRMLALAYNKLTDVSVVFNSQMVSLEILDISNNKIDSISYDVFMLKRLEHLNIENNSISKLSTILGIMDNLKNLKIYGNPIKNMKREMMEKPSNVILDYLKDKHPTPVYKPDTTSGSGNSVNKDYNPTNYSAQNQIIDSLPKGQRMDLEYDSTNYINQPSSNNMISNPNNGSGTNSTNKGMIKVEEPKSVVTPNKLDLKRELEQVDATILRLENELQDNYNMPKQTQLLKKKEINSLRAAKNKLLNSVNQ